MWGEYFDYHTYDVFSIWKNFCKEKNIKLVNNKLATVAEFFELKFEAHEAQSDIEVTREIGGQLANAYRSTSME